MTATSTPNDTEIQLLGTSLYSAVPLEETKLTALATIKVPDTPEDEDDNEDEINDARVPVILVAVVDKSGSMSGDKISSLKETLTFVINEMSKKDRLAIVEYDTNVKTTLSLTVMDDNGKRLANTVAKNIRTGSSTNMSGGLESGLKLIPNDIDSNTVASVLLMTDGHANYGIQTASGMIEMMKNLQSQGYGRCTVNTFGFGKDHNASALNEISDAGEGMYYFIENADSIASSFADCLGGLLSVAAQGIELTVEACEGCKIGRLHTPKPSTTVEEGKKYRIAFGDLQEGESRDIPFEITLNSCSSSSSNTPIIKLSASYFHMKKETMVDCETTITIDRIPKDELTDEQRKPNLEVNRHSNRVAAADATETAVSLANNNQLERARELLQKTMKEIKESPSANEEMTKGLITQLENSLQSLRSRESYSREGQYSMNQCYKAMKMQRCAASPVAMECASMSYETSARKKMKKKFSKKC